MPISWSSPWHSWLRRAPCANGSRSRPLPRLRLRPPRHARPLPRVRCRPRGEGGAGMRRKLFTLAAGVSAVAACLLLAVWIAGAGDRSLEVWRTAVDYDPQQCGRVTDIHLGSTAGQSIFCLSEIDLPAEKQAGPTHGHDWHAGKAWTSLGERVFLTLSRGYIGAPKPAGPELAAPWGSIYAFPRCGLEGVVVMAQQCRCLLSAGLVPTSGCRVGRRRRYRLAGRCPYCGYDRPRHARLRGLAVAFRVGARH